MSSASTIISKRFCRTLSEKIGACSKEIVPATLGLFFSPNRLVNLRTMTAIIAQRRVDLLSCKAILSDDLVNTHPFSFMPDNNISHGNSAPGDVWLSVKNVRVFDNNCRQSCQDRRFTVLGPGK